MLPPAVAYLATSLMRSVVEEGTATAVRELNRPAAGKTGTAQEYRDALVHRLHHGLGGLGVGGLRRPHAARAAARRAAAPRCRSGCDFMKAARPGPAGARLRGAAGRGAGEHRPRHRAAGRQRRCPAAPSPSSRAPSPRRRRPRRARSTPTTSSSTTAPAEAASSAPTPRHAASQPGADATECARITQRCTEGIDGPPGMADGGCP